MTKPTVRVLSLLLAATAGGCYGLELIEKAEVGPGTIYPMLSRLEQLGWVNSHWEDIDPSTAGRPARRYYELTATGRIEAAALLERRPQLIREWLAEA